MSSQPVETPAVEATPAAAAPVAATETAAPAAAAAVEEATPAPAAAAATEAPAAAEAPVAAETPAEAAEPAAPAEPEVTPIQALYAAAQKHAHPEIWGVTLADPATHVPSQIVFQKFLNANDGNLDKATEQLTKTLDWRAEAKPLESISQEYSREKFEGLGYVTTYYSGAKEDHKPEEPESKQVFTWNVYGNTKNIATTFSDTAEFIKWRVALMELAIKDLSLATATKEITADYDPYKLTQVHDYKSVSFLRQTAQVKASSKATIEVFAANYPELLKEKYFVNVPAIMGFFYSFIKVFVATKTVKKFHPVSNGKNLAKEFAAGLAEKLPTEYGGKAEGLATTGVEPTLAAAVEVPEEVAPVAEAPKEEAAPAVAAEAAPEAAPEAATETVPEAAPAAAPEAVVVAAEEAPKEAAPAAEAKA